MKNIILAILCAAAIVSAASAAPATPFQRLRVAMLSDGGDFNDNSFNQSCREGLAELLFAEKPIYAQFFESIPSTTYARHLAAFAERGYDIIIGVGVFMGPDLRRTALKYPSTRFINVDSKMSDIPENVLVLSFRVDECAFPAGYLAAFWADSKDPDEPAVASIAGMTVSSVSQFITGFEAGVRLYNERFGRNVRILQGIVGSFTNPVRGRTVSERLLAEGADVLFNVAGLSGVGVFEAAKTAGKWAIGVDVDQYYVLPEYQDIILTSCLKRMDRAVSRAVSDALEGQFWGGTRAEGTLANHGVGLAPYHDFDELIPESIQKDILDIQRKIISGALSTGWVEPEEPGPAPKRPRRR